MIGNIRIPYINGGSTEQQLYQVKNYLYQLVEQLNFTLNSIETTSATAGTTVAASSPAQKPAIRPTSWLDRKGASI